MTARPAWSRACSPAADAPASVGAGRPRDTIAPYRGSNDTTSDRIVAAAGLPRIVFHDLRRTAATLLKALGVPARDAQVILGHANTITLCIYSEVFDTEIAAALIRLDGALGSIPRGTTPDVEPDAP